MVFYTKTNAYLQKSYLRIKGLSDCSTSYQYHYNNKLNYTKSPTNEKGKKKLKK